MKDALGTNALQTSNIWPRLASASIQAGTYLPLHRALRRFDRTYHTDLAKQRSLSTQNTVSQWHAARDFRATGLNGAIGGAGADALREPRSFPWRVCAQQQTTFARHNSPSTASAARRAHRRRPPSATDKRHTVTRVRVSLCEGQ